MPVLHGVVSLRRLTVTASTRASATANVVASCPPDLPSIDQFVKHSEDRLFNKLCNKLWCESTTNPVPVLRIAASHGFSELTKNVTRSSHGHSTPSLKIPCKSAQPFSCNLADKETKKQRRYKGIDRKQYPVTDTNNNGHTLPRLPYLLAPPNTATEHYNLRSASSHNRLLPAGTVHLTH